MMPIDVRYNDGDNSDINDNSNDKHIRRKREQMCHK